MSRADIASAFRFQADWCRKLDSPFTADLLDQAAASLDRDGPFSKALHAWPGDPVADALALRVAGALHRRVLNRQDEVLAASYPRADRAGDPAGAWRQAEGWIAADHHGFTQELRSPPQTNETRRSLGLFPGLLLLAARFGRPMDLYELGASAGLNLLLDRFAYATPSWTWGEGQAVVVEGDWRGSPPPLATAPQVAARFGCDRNPLDPRDPADRLRLKSFVWADQFARMARLEAALDAAATEGVRVERADAGDWIAERLPQRRKGRLAVVFHSVFWQYPPEETRAKVRGAVEAAGAVATEETPLAWLRLEPAEGSEGSRPSGHWLDLAVWPGGERQVLAQVDPHGRWADWKL